AVGVGGGQELAVGTEYRDERPRTRDGLAVELACGDVPEADRAVVVGGGQELAVGTEYRDERPDTRDRLASGIACGDVPEADRAVEAGGGQELAVGAEGDPVDRARTSPSQEFWTHDQSSDHAHNQQAGSKRSVLLPFPPTRDAEDR